MIGTKLVRGAWMAVAVAGAACSSTGNSGTTPTGQDMATMTDAAMKPPTPPDLAQAQPMLPFVVDTVFVSSGFMGDGATAGSITMVPAKTGDSTDCNGMRASTSAAGSCHVITYTPPTTDMGATWGGVYWQYPANNWGTKPGFAVPPGAKKVTFQARGAKGGEKVQFLAGGIVNAGSQYTDSIKASVMVTLTNSWAPYQIDVTGQSYSQVLGGFGWTMAAADAGASATFFVDNIEWQ